ncbi:hypothetical protein A8C32_01480 [Flavivirga aquatica]|uniref:STAS domain-containing protein n=1 Tax=Flavivirga aquatica TaxID=1849968 RepID=A0A1E5T9U8_9FLAO|nr:STAS domain-containing protein [Flavivirga aquatica]OEK08160.1 hypothetical protein A8C32_01480 [Flavivirga aquatica]
MDFKIINNKGIFEIHGDFTNIQTNQVADYFSNLLDKYYEIIICLKQVDKIDNTAIKVIRSIAAKARRRSKILFVLGKENENITKQLKKANLNIYKNDYAN